MTSIFTNLKVSKENCSKALTEDIYATEKVYELVKRNTPFREAYKTISEKY
jgi:argininosuccinate lyase